MPPPKSRVAVYSNGFFEVAPTAWDLPTSRHSRLPERAGTGSRPYRDFASGVGSRSTRAASFATRGRLTGSCVQSRARLPAIRGLRRSGGDTKVRALMVARIFASTLLLCLAACTSEIGDDCTTSSECATTDSSRICITQLLEGFPGGYCTIFNCEPGSCPGEASCIGFRTSLANDEPCEGSFASTRLQRSYCMRTCSNDSDCRSGYACVDVDQDENPWGATVLEEGSRRERSKICTVAYSEPAEAPDRSSEVCRWQPAGDLPDAAVPPSLPTQMGTDAAPPSRRDAGATPDASVADGAAPVAPDARSPVDSSADAAPAATVDGG